MLVFLIVSQEGSGVGRDVMICGMNLVITNTRQFAGNKRRAERELVCIYEPEEQCRVLFSVWDLQTYINLLDQKRLKLYYSNI